MGTPRFITHIPRLESRSAWWSFNFVLAQPAMPLNSRSVTPQHSEMACSANTSPCLVEFSKRHVPTQAPEELCAGSLTQAFYATTKSLPWKHTSTLCSGSPQKICAHPYRNLHTAVHFGFIGSLAKAFFGTETSRQCIKSTLTVLNMAKCDRVPAVLIGSHLRGFSSDDGPPHLLPVPPTERALWLYNVDHPEPTPDTRG